MTHAEMMYRLHSFIQKVSKDKNASVTEGDLEALKKAMLLLECAFERYEEKHNQ